jgi:hypothetical protein
MENSAAAEDDMFDPSLSIEERVRRYAAANGRQLEQSLGFGKDGVVFSTNANTAIKVFAREDVFARERNCYLRLMEMHVQEVMGHYVPQLLHSDEEYLVLEMTTVRPPFLLDFASAWLDWPPDFSPEILEEWHQRKSEEFGRHWPRVLVLLKFLEENYGIFLTDVHPGNITFEENDPA